MKDGSDAPQPHVRQAMVDYALKNSKFKQLAQSPKTTEEQVIERLEHNTGVIFNTCADIVREAIRNGGSSDANANNMMAMGLWKDALAKESRDDLHFMLSLVLTAITLERLEEVN